MIASRLYIGLLCSAVVLTLACEPAKPPNRPGGENTKMLYDGTLSSNTAFSSSLMSTDEELVGDFLASEKLSNGRIGLAYFNKSRGCLEIALENGPDTLDFKRQCIRGAGTTIFGHHIAMIADGDTLHIVAQNKTTDTPYYVPVTPSGFPEPVEIDNGQRGRYKHQIGLWPSIAVDAKGNLLVSYFNESLQTIEVRMLPKGETDWRVISIEPRHTDQQPTTLYGPHSSFVVTPNNDILLGMYNAQSRTAVVAQLVDAEETDRIFDMTTIDADGDVGSWIRGTVDGDGNAVFAYYDKDNGQLKLSRRRKGKFTTPVVVDDSGHAGTDIAFALDQQGRLLIAYMGIVTEDSAFDPKLAFEHADGSFGTVTLATEGVGGFFNALEIDSSGRPIVFDNLFYLPNANPIEQQRDKIRILTPKSS